jgi:cytochrome c oxidase assembly protein subunit 15
MAMSHRRRFQTLGLATIFAVYFLILVGGIVRASGSGMGCPDWPRCFGRWVPPTDASQLPDNVQELYGEHGQNEPFNALKTWTEYVNRLVGVAIGFSIFLLLLASLPFWRVDRALVWWSLAAFLLVGFQGWLGSVVVSTNLAPWIVTLHMLLALLIVAILIYVVVRSHRGELEGVPLIHRRSLFFILVAALALSLVQVLIGTQVREQVDEVALRGALRGDWISELGTLLLVHRSFSLLVLAAVVLLWLAIRRASEAREGDRLRLLGDLLLVAVAIEIAAGALLYYLAMPALLQPVHLLFGSVLVGLELAIAVLYRQRRSS